VIYLAHGAIATNATGAATQAVLATSTSETFIYDVRAAQRIVPGRPNERSDLLSQRVPLLPGDGCALPELSLRCVQR